MNSYSNYDVLVTVTTKQSSFSPYSPFVQPQTLLRYNREAETDSYVIHDLSSFSSRFTADENIYILTHQVTSDFPEHTHDYIEVNYILQGELANVIDGKKFYMTTGDLAVINPLAVQKLEFTGTETLLLNLCLKQTVFERTLKSFYQDENPLSDFMRGDSREHHNYIFYSLGHNARAQALISWIIQEYADSGFRQSFALEALIILLFTELAKSNEHSYYGIDDHSQDIIRYIQANCIHATLGIIAGELGYHPSYLTSYIKKHTGRSCRDIIQETKLQASLALLKDTDTNIYRISEECGYSSPSHFFRVFKEKFHMTPNEYRRQFL